MALSTVYLAQRNAAISHGLVGVYGRFLVSANAHGACAVYTVGQVEGNGTLRLGPVGDHQFGPWRLGHVTVETS